MINRVLIRIKVVQMLYSYLLTRNEFKIEPAPGPDATRDATFAYRLYLDLIMLVMELSGQRVGTHRPAMQAAIAANRFLSTSPLARAIGLDEQIRVAINPAASDIAVFDSALASIFDTITRSDDYLTHSRKRDRSLSSDMDFWAWALDKVISRDNAFIDAARSLPDFTMSGFNRAFSMFARNIHSYPDNSEMRVEAEHNLKLSLDKAYDLYNGLFNLAIQLTDLQARRLDAAKHKYMPTDADLHPDTRFIDNKLIAALEANKELADYGKDHDIDWSDDDTTLRLILNSILESDTYKAYMAEPGSSWERDCELWRELFRKVILPGDALAEALESKSVYWNDDLDIMGTFVTKTLKQFAASRKDGADVHLLPQYKDDEDAEFGNRLFNEAVNHREEYRGLIARFINPEQWDTDRLAFMDIVVMMAAIAELRKFPSIPVPVTLNEYIEIANSYSTPRSGQFVNGVLFSVINYLKAEGMLDKPITNPRK